MAQDQVAASGDGVREGEAQTGSTEPRQAQALLGIGGSSALALAFMIYSGVGLAGLLAAHALLLVALAWLVRQVMAQRADVTVAVLALVAGAVVGPLGPLGAALLDIAGSGGHAPSPLVEKWYERIALSTAIEPDVRLCDDVGVGRTLDLGAQMPQSFPALMETGPLIKRQAILGYIARHFHPAYLATLQVALESPEPTLRVQAAAVAAHVGGEVRGRVREVLERVGAGVSGAGEALDLLGDLDLLAVSGLIDETERKAANEGRQLLSAFVLAGLKDGVHGVLQGEDAALLTLRTATLEKLLIERGLFADLRAARAAHAIRVGRPAARFRRLSGIATRAQVAGS